MNAKRVVYWVKPSFQVIIEYRLDVALNEFLLGFIMQMKNGQEQTQSPICCGLIKSMPLS